MRTLNAKEFNQSPAGTVFKFDCPAGIAIVLTANFHEGTSFIWRTDDGDLWDSDGEYLHGGTSSVGCWDTPEEVLDLEDINKLLPALAEKFNVPLSLLIEKYLPKCYRNKDGYTWVEYMGNRYQEKDPEQYSLY